MPSDPRAVRRTTTTFKIRRRSMSSERQQQFDVWMQRWSLGESGPDLDWDDLFGRSIDVVLDIGFGHGESVIHRMVAEPSTAVVGVEVHTPGVAAVLEAIDATGVNNVRVVHGDALTFLGRIPSCSLAAVQIFFPDPWPKVRHHHRRLVGADVVAAVAERLRLGGTLHLATDIGDYAEAMQAACTTDPRLMGGPIGRPDTRPLTRFEQRGLAAGRTVIDLLYRRIT